MNNNSTKPKKKVSEMRAEYDFSGGIRGKHAAAYSQGHSVTIHKKDGSTVVQYFTLEDGAVMIDPDVREYFPDAESVNSALRSLIAIASKSGIKVSRVSRKTKQPSTAHSTK
jgi:hypothetical protein